MSDPVTLKYVRHSTAGFVVWPRRLPGLAHKEIARAIRSSEDVQRGEMLSAGFIDFDYDGLPFCHGRSESLDLNSMASDTAALRAEWGMKPVVMSACELAAAQGFPEAPPLVLNAAAMAEAQKFGEGMPEVFLEPSEPAL